MAAKKSSAANSAKTARRGKPFEKGNAHAYQPGQSGNPSGRPKSHDDLRDLIQQLGAEKASPRAKQVRINALLTKMYASRDSRDHANILEHGWGKVPQQVLTWQDELVDALRKGKVKPSQVIAELGAELAEPILVAAGVRADEDGEAAGEGAAAGGNAA